MMGTLILAVVCSFLFVAVLIGLAEKTGGYFGDSSMVPGCLGVMVLVVAAIVVVGMLTGHAGIWIK